MDTRVTFNKKTGEMSIDVLDAVGTECQEKNAEVYRRLRDELGMDDTSINEVVKPEMYETRTDEQEEQLGD